MDNNIKGFFSIKKRVHVNITCCDLNGIDVLGCYYKKQVNIIVSRGKKDDDVLINTVIDRVLIDKSKTIVL